MFEYKTIDMFEVSEKRLGRENMKWDFAFGEPKIGYRSSPIWSCLKRKKISPPTHDPAKKLSDMNNIFNVWIV